MQKPLEILILEEELRRARIELSRALGEYAKVPDELGESPYLKGPPVHSGPEFLEVRASCWSRGLETDHGMVRSLAEARTLAEGHGLKGISITFGKGTNAQNNSK